MNGAPSPGDDGRSVTGDPLRTLIASCGGTFVVTFDGAAVQMVLPALRRELHAPISSAQWMMTAFLLATTTGS